MRTDAPLDPARLSCTHGTDAVFPLCSFLSYSPSGPEGHFPGQTPLPSSWLGSGSAGQGPILVSPFSCSYFSETQICPWPSWTGNLGAFGTVFHQSWSSCLLPLPYPHAPSFPWYFPLFTVTCILSFWSMTCSIKDCSPIRSYRLVT